MVDIVADPFGVFDFAQKDIDAVALVTLEDMLKSEVDREGEKAAGGKDDGNVPIVFGAALGKPEEEVAECQDEEDADKDELVDE